MNIIDEFKIEGFQNLQQYLKINPINIQITDPEIQNKLLFYANRYKYRFISNSLLFSSPIQKDTNVIFIMINGLNNAKEILINGKLFQGIGLIYTSEREGWKNIFKKIALDKHCINRFKISNCSKTFCIQIEATNLHNLLNFEYLLLDEEGKLIEFKTGEDKISAINFTIQIIN